MSTPRSLNSEPEDLEQDENDARMEAYAFVQDIVRILQDPMAINRDALFQRSAVRLNIVRPGQEIPPEREVAAVEPAEVRRPAVRQPVTVVRPEMAGRRVIRPSVHPGRKVYDLESFREMLEEMQLDLPSEPLTSSNLKGLIDDEILDNLKSIAIKTAHGDSD
jgi:hypothetical protein